MTGDPLAIYPAAELRRELTSELLERGSRGRKSLPVISG
jgi:hypothetical protein